MDSWRSQPMWVTEPGWPTTQEASQIRHLLRSITETMRRTQHGALLIVAMGALSDFSNGQANSADRVLGQGQGVDATPHQFTVLLEMANQGNARAQWSLGTA